MWIVRAPSGQSDRGIRKKNQNQRIKSTLRRTPRMHLLVLVFIYPCTSLLAGTSGDWYALTSIKPQQPQIGFKVFKNENLDAAHIEAEVERKANRLINQRYEQLQARYGRLFPNSWKVNPFVQFYAESELSPEQKTEVQRQKKIHHLEEKPLILMENLLPQDHPTFSFKSIALEKQIDSLKNFITEGFTDPKDHVKILDLFFKKLYEITLLSILTGVTIDDSDFFIIRPKAHVTDPKNYINQLKIKIADLGEATDILQPIQGNPLFESQMNFCHANEAKLMSTFFLADIQQVIQVLEANNGEYYVNKMKPLTNLITTILNETHSSYDEKTSSFYRTAIEGELRKFKVPVQKEIQEIMRIFSLKNCEQKNRRPNVNIKITQHYCEGVIQAY
ncbi:MAG: hypothetical protein ACO3A2_02350 [Bdellovibrionia bacterium]